MKHYRWLLIVLCLLLALTGCGARSLQDEASRALELDLSAGTAVSERDTHGGFHRDGMSFLKLSFPDDALADVIAADPAWNPLPLSNVTTALVYGLRSEQDGSDLGWGPYLTDEQGEPLVSPAVENGWYRFIDRHAQSYDSADESEVLERGSFNFTLALYDADRNELYYLTLDT